jgi:hypothetical protein
MYRSSFTATGWGSRALTPDELGVAFGFPSWLRHDGLLVSSFPLVPIQILDGVYAESSPRSRPSNRYPSSLLAALLSRLPCVRKFLSHDWIDASVVTSKAAKRDDAAPPTHLWDARCVLVFPHLGPALPHLRVGVMPRIVYKLFKEFAVYMREHYGSQWASLLVALRFQQIHDRVPLERKRTRGGWRRKFQSIWMVNCCVMERWVATFSHDLRKQPGGNGKAVPL